MTLLEAFSILFVLSFAIQAARTSTLEPRKSIQNQLMCQGRVPSLHSRLWPQSLRAEQKEFESLLRLCAWSTEETRTVGCICYGPGQKIECQPGYGDAVLSNHEPLRMLCENNCQCPKLPTPDGQPRPPVLQIPEPVYEPSDPEVMPVYQFGTLTRPRMDRERLWGEPIGDNLFPTNSRFRLRKHHRPAYYTKDAEDDFFVDELRPSTCPTACAPNTFQCSKGCHCPVDQVSSGLWRIAGCVASGLGKRDDSTTPACPCNATYISGGCCGVEDGLVWEHPSQNLGRLDI